METPTVPLNPKYGWPHYQIPRTIKDTSPNYLTAKQDIFVSSTLRDKEVPIFLKSKTCQDVSLVSTSFVSSHD